MLEIICLLVFLINIKVSLTLEGLVVKQVKKVIKDIKTGKKEIIILVIIKDF